MAGYPWQQGQNLHFDDLNAAFALAYANAQVAITQSSQALVAANSALAVAQSAAQERLKVAITLSWPAGITVAPGTYILAGSAPYGFSIASVDSCVGSGGGSFQVAVLADANTLQNLGGLTINQPSKSNTPLPLAPSVQAGQMLSVVVSAVSGSPAGAYLTLNGSRTLS